MRIAATLTELRNGLAWRDVVRVALLLARHGSSLCDWWLLIYKLNKGLVRLWLEDKALETDTLAGGSGWVDRFFYFFILQTYLAFVDLSCVYRLRL